MATKKHVTKRAQTVLEVRIPNAIQHTLPTEGLVLELLLGQTDAGWRSCVHGGAVADLLIALKPIAKWALRRYGLARDPYIDDAVQRLAMKLQEGRCFKNYRALDASPRVYLLGCAPMYAMTIARSIWRERRRHGEGEDGIDPSAVRCPRPLPSDDEGAACLEPDACAY